MRYTRNEHRQFLEDELRSQTKAFKEKLESSAEYLLLEKEEVFVAKLLKFKEGEMILKFPTKRGIPRSGEYLYCFTVPKQLRNYRNWKKASYGDLIKEKGLYTEAVCIWQAPINDDVEFCIAGFRGVDLEFASSLESVSDLILVLGPNKPPYEYILNLQNIVLNNNTIEVNEIFDADFNNDQIQHSELDKKKEVINFILTQLSLVDTIILEGPPGTGKTYLIAEICNSLCKNGKSVLVTALTNRALIEVAGVVPNGAEKPALNSLLENGRVFKTKISLDESKNIPRLEQTNTLTPQPGNLILSTFYITSAEAAESNSLSKFDYVIVDEASQALIAMFGVARILGEKNIWIGDTNQLPPVVSINEDKVIRKSYDKLVDGMKALVSLGTVPTYQLSTTYRLTKRAASYTEIFYPNKLASSSTNKVSDKFITLDLLVKRYIHPNGGPCLVKLNLEVGNRKPSNGVSFILNLIAHIFYTTEGVHLSVLSYFVDTTKALQKACYQKLGYHKNLLIETVSRVQGLTTDITIFFIPNSGYNWSLEKRLFNVATSRSRGATIIISDTNIISNNPNLDGLVRQYLERLDDEFSFEVDLGQFKLK